MRYLIVNADDFGASPGVNRGIFEAHCRGVVTSASLFVDAPGSAEAARMGRAAPLLGLGLHADLRGLNGNGRDPEAVLHELTRQVERFVELMGRPPSHIDSHRDSHRDSLVAPVFLEVARRFGVALRGHSRVRCLSAFYGQWAGESHFEQIRAASLARILEAEVGDGITELICHPGYCDALLTSSYTREREVEVDTLCDPMIRRRLADLDIELVSHDSVARLSGPR